MIDLYVVESPLQALSAAEAKALNGDQVESVIFVKSGLDARQVHNGHLERSISFGEWENVVWLGFSKYTKLKYHLSLIRLLLTIKKRYRGRVRNLYLGEFRSDWMLYLRCVIDPAKTFLLDDGAATLTVQERYLSKNILWPEALSGRFLRDAIKRFLYKWMHDDRVARNMIHLFTSFDIPPAPGQEVLKHSFEFARKNIHVVESKPEVYYFGAKYSEAGIMTVRSEIEFLSMVFDYYKNLGLVVVYVPHRDDSIAKVDLISKKFDVDVRSLDCSAEIYFSLSGYIPFRVAAAYSSVLNNLRFFRGSEGCDSFVIPAPMIERKYRGNISNIYSYYRKVGINIVDFESRNKI